MTHLETNVSTPLPPFKAVCHDPLYPLTNSTAYQGGDINILPRDKTQSHRLHEPTYRLTTTDPMNGADIDSASDPPSLVTGNLTIYFINEETRRAFVRFPINHPNLRLPYPELESDDRGG